MNTKYFVYLLAILLAGCKKKKKVMATADTFTQLEEDTNLVEAEVEYTEKSVDNTQEEAQQLDQVAGVQDRVYFAYDRDSISQSDDLKVMADLLLANEKITITIYGNCDIRGSASYNVGLGARRATAVKNILVANGVDSQRIKTISLGQTILVEGDNEQAYAKNRVAIIEIDGGPSNVKKIQESVNKSLDVAKTNSSNSSNIASVNDEDEEEDDDDNE